MIYYVLTPLPCLFCQDSLITKTHFFDIFKLKFERFSETGHLFSTDGKNKLQFAVLRFELADPSPSLRDGHGPKDGHVQVSTRSGRICKCVFQKPS